MNNDLISRSALKEEFAKHEDRKGYLIGDWEDIIDNAPTVEQSYQAPKDYIKNKLDYSRPHGDLISRTWLKEHKFTTTIYNGIEPENIEVVPVASIDNAPPVTVGYLTNCANCERVEKIRAKRPKGKWIIDGHHYKCSRCGKTLAIMFSETDDDDLIGCPFCLADMRVKRELGGRE